MFIRLQHLVTVAVLALGSAASAQAAGASDGLCIEDMQVDRALAAALDRLVATTAVTLRAPGQCADAGLVGRFSGLDPVVFTLHTAGGERFARAVPWLIRPDAALARLRAQRRLSAFAVLIEGLLAEWRIATGSGRDARPPATPPDAGAPAPSAGADTTRPGRARATAARRARRPRRAEPAPPPGAGDAAAAGEPPAPAAEPPQTTEPTRPDERPDEPPELPDELSDERPDEPPELPDELPELPLVPVDEPGVSMPVESSPHPLLAEEPPAATAADVPVRWRLEIPHVRPPAAPAPARTPAATPTAPAVAHHTGTAPDPRASAAASTDLDPRADIDDRRAGIDARARRDPQRATPWPSPEAVTAVRVRQTAAPGLEIGAGLSWRSLFASGARQLPSSWDLEGRPIQLDAMVFAAGYRPVLYRAGAWRIQLTVTANLERLSLRRTDLASARSHSYWDPGLAAGGALTRDIGGWLRVRVQLDACRQLGRTVRIPDGPEAAFNHRGARATLSLAWLP